jgi:hypothetical protein
MTHKKKKIKTVHVTYTKHNETRKKKKVKKTIRQNFNDKKKNKKLHDKPHKLVKKKTQWKHKQWHNIHNHKVLNAYTHTACTYTAQAHSHSHTHTHTPCDWISTQALSCIQAKPWEHTHTRHATQQNIFTVQSTLQQKNITREQAQKVLQILKWLHSHTHTNKHNIHRHMSQHEHNNPWHTHTQTPTKKKNTYKRYTRKKKQTNITNKAPQKKSNTRKWSHKGVT